MMTFAKRRIKNRKGFTLVELLVVIAIIGILAAVIAPNAFKAIEKAKMDKVIADCKAIEAAALMHYSDTGEWPRFHGTGNTNMEGFLRNYGTGLTGWDGPYLERWPINPFNSAALESEQNYQLDYRYPRNVNGVALGDLVIEISLNGVDNYRALEAKIDNTIDNGDGENNGKIRGTSGWNNAYITWIISQNAENVKYENNNPLVAH